MSRYVVFLGFAGALASGGSCNSTKGGDGGNDGGSGSGGEVGDGSASGDAAAGGANPSGGAGPIGGGNGGATPPPPKCNLPDPPKLKLTPVAKFPEPVLAVAQPAGDNRLYVAERHGLIHIVKDGQIVEPPFLDMRASVGGFEGNGGVSEGERGLMNLVFDPKYADNGRFYVFYTRSATDPYFDGPRRKGDVVVAQGRRSSDPEKAEPALTQLISVQHDGIDGRNGCCDDGHNGGFLGFGPDGHLYAAIGDGGGAANVYGTKPGLSTIVRFNVESPQTPVPGGLGGEGPLAFAWAKGVRNPFRGSFDSQTGDLYFGDVGEANWEELNFLPASQLTAQGLDFGWANPGMEGTRVVKYWPYKVLGDAPRGVLPVLEYEHPVNPARPSNRLGRAVVGGVVYRGKGIAGLAGRYFYGDHPSNTVSSLVMVEGRPTCVVDHTADLANAQTRIEGLTGFAHPNGDRLYMFDLKGNVYQIEKE